MHESPDQSIYEAVYSSSDQGEGVFLIDDPPLTKMKKTKLFKEVFLIILTAIPFSSALILSYFPNALNLYFISKNNDLFDICAIGSFLILANITGGLFLNALNNNFGRCIANLNDQQTNASFRAPYNKYATGLYFHRSLVLGTIYMSFWSILLCYSGEISRLAFKVPAEFSIKLETYALFLIPSIYFSFCFDLTRNLLISCEVLSLPCSFLVLTIFLHYLFCILFEFERNFGIEAASFCKNITDFLNTFLIMLYAWTLKSLHKVWIPWTSNSFKTLLSHLDLNGLFEKFLELLSLEVLNVAVLVFGDLKEVTPFFLISCIQSMNLAINQGFAETIRVLIWKAIKEGAINKAKNRSFLGFYLGILLALSQWLCFFVLKSIVFNSILKDDFTQINFLRYSDFYSIKIFLDVFLLFLIDLLKALQNFRFSFYLHILGFFGLAMFLMGYFVFFGEIKVVDGLWIGFMIAETSVLLFAATYLCLFVDWKKEINKICLNKLRRNLNNT